MLTMCFPPFQHMCYCMGFPRGCDLCNTPILIRLCGTLLLATLSPGALVSVAIVVQFIHLNVHSNLTSNQPARSCKSRKIWIASLHNDSPRNSCSAHGKILRKSEKRNPRKRWAQSNKNWRHALSVLLFNLRVNAAASCCPSFARQREQLCPAANPSPCPP